MKGAETSATLTVTTAKQPDLYHEYLSGLPRDVMKKKYVLDDDRTVSMDDSLRRCAWDWASDSAKGDFAALALYHELTDMMFAQEENIVQDDSGDNEDLPF